MEKERAKADGWPMGADAIPATEKGTWVVIAPQLWDPVVSPSVTSSATLVMERATQLHTAQQHIRSSKVKAKVLAVEVGKAMERATGSSKARAPEVVVSKVVVKEIGRADGKQKEEKERQEKAKEEDFTKSICGTTLRQAATTGTTIGEMIGQRCVL